MGRPEFDAKVRQILLHFTAVLNGARPSASDEAKVAGSPATDQPDAFDFVKRARARSATHRQSSRRPPLTAAGRRGIGAGTVSAVVAGATSPLCFECYLRIRGPPAPRPDRADSPCTGRCFLSNGNHDLESPSSRVVDMQLDEFRLVAAQRSGGISNQDIYRVALEQSHRLKPDPDTILDYGAGTGSFTRELHKLFPKSSVSAADIMARPNDLGPAINWIEQDLNAESKLPRAAYDLVFAIEVLEHLENPRKTMRDLYDCLRPQGVAVITTPNVLSIKSLLQIVVRGHFAAFDDSNYPAHITPLSVLDLTRCAQEAGFVRPEVFFMNNGKIPKFLHHHWRDLPLVGRRLRGKLFSDNFGLCVVRPG